MVMFHSYVAVYQRVIETSSIEKYLTMISGWWCNFTILKNDGVSNSWDDEILNGNS